MQVFDISKEKFAALNKLKLPYDIYNNESELYLITSPNGHQFLIKKFIETSGEQFANKLYTVEELIQNKSQIDIDELVLPTSLLAIDGNIVGYIMPYIPNVNLQNALDSENISLEIKVDYLKQVGKMLEKMHNLRKNSKLKDFYLNDVHENNFIVDEKGKVRAIDMDSVKIGNNIATQSRYLMKGRRLPQNNKYQTNENELGGAFEINADTEIYCYIMMIFHFFAGIDISLLSIEEYYEYLEYLRNLGISNKLIEIFSYIYEDHPNENMVQYIDELLNHYYDMDIHIFRESKKSQSK